MHKLFLRGRPIYNIVIAEHWFDIRVDFSNNILMGLNPLIVLSFYRSFCILLDENTPIMSSKAEGKWKLSRDCLTSSVGIDL